MGKETTVFHSFAQKHAAEIRKLTQSLKQMNLELGEFPSANIISEEDDQALPFKQHLFLTQAVHFSSFNVYNAIQHKALTLLLKKLTALINENCPEILANKQAKTTDMLEHSNNPQTFMPMFIEQNIQESFIQSAKDEPSSEKKDPPCCLTQ